MNHRCTGTQWTTVTKWITATLGLEPYLQAQFLTGCTNLKRTVSAEIFLKEDRILLVPYIPYPVHHTVPTTYSSISSAAQRTYRYRSTYVRDRPQLIKVEEWGYMSALPWRSPSWQIGLPPPLPPFPVCPPLPPFPVCPPLPPCPPSHSFYLKTTPEWLITLRKVAIVKQSYKQLWAEEESMRKTNTFPTVRVNFYVLYIIEG